MPNFPGYQPDIIEFFDVGRKFPPFLTPQDTAPDPDGVHAEQSDGALQNLGTVTRVAVVQEQQAHPGYAIECSWDKILPGFYVIPTEVAVGLIIETSTQDILVWNSDPNNPLTVSTIQAVNPSGTTLDAPTPPIVLPPGVAQVHVLTILKDGPAVQNTSYIYSTALVSRTVKVTGQRILAWPFEPNWGQRTQETLEFKTVKYANKRLVEQRRPRIVTPLRSQRADYLYGQDERKRLKFLNQVRRLHRSILAVPIYSEILTPTTDIQGLVTVTLNEDISNHIHAGDLSDLYLIVSRAEDFQAELKRAASTTANSITFAVPVVEDFKAGDTFIYPTFPGLIQSKNVSAPTNQVLTASLEFKEIRPDSG